MDELTKEFKQETEELVKQLIDILEEAEKKPYKLKLLEQYGQIVDRIMGGAKSLAVSETDHKIEIDKIGNYAELCKLIGYKASQVENNTQLVDICIAFLLDATERIQLFSSQLLDKGSVDVKSELSETFLDRLKWLETKFDENLRGSLNIKVNKEKSEQETIDHLLKAMGV